MWGQTRRSHLRSLALSTFSSRPLCPEEFLLASCHQVPIWRLVGSFFFLSLSSSSSSSSSSSPFISFISWGLRPPPHFLPPRLLSFRTWTPVAPGGCSTFPLNNFQWCQQLLKQKMYLTLLLFYPLSLIGVKFTCSFFSRLLSFIFSLSSFFLSFSFLDFSSFVEHFHMPLDGRYGSIGAKRIQN